MPTPTRCLTPESARESIRERSFMRTSGDLVGAELEFFTTPSDDPPDIATLETLFAGVELPGASRITFEPGGQVELSSVPFTVLGDLCHALDADVIAIRRLLATAGIGMFAAGLDPDRSQQLQTDAPRYVAMRKFFDEFGGVGSRMMCTTAAIHTNVDAGHDAEGRERWRAANVLGPMFAAAFADSPIVGGRPSGWKSTRLATWFDLDPTRTTPVGDADDPAGAWAEYALAARVMFIRSDGRYVPFARSFTFNDWIADGHELGFPDDDDLAYHLTTLFPPVRPRGCLELRMVDMLPGMWWRAAVALTTAVVCDQATRDVALASSEGIEGMWEIAARCGLEDPRLNQCASTAFTAALGAIERMGCDAVTSATTVEYVERFTLRGRTPADDRLDGVLPPIAEAI